MLFARALFVLACAAPLLANPGARYDGQCDFKLLGVNTNKLLRLPVVTIAAGIQKARVDIPNNCVNQGLLVRGELITVCDDVRPIIQADRFTPVSVTRKGSLRTPAYIYVEQYCGLWNTTK